LASMVGSQSQSMQRTLIKKGLDLLRPTTDAYTSSRNLDARHNYNPY
jgi:hypothetical protein